MESKDECCCPISITIMIGLVFTVIIRIIYIFYRSDKPLRPNSPKPMSTLIVLGSGGHTAEMINVMSVLQKDRFSPTFYIAAATDNMSLQKARVLEDSLVDTSGGKVVSAKFIQIYRIREVGQSYTTSIGTTLVAIAHALWLMIKIRPQVILCNGPGTCVPLCIIAFLFKVVGIRCSSIFMLRV